jgi:lipoprotein-anchoring transpeptidase ErfK/SrfK
VPTHSRHRIAVTGLAFLLGAAALATGGCGSADPVTGPVAAPSSTTPAEPAAGAPEQPAAPAPRTVEGRLLVHLTRGAQLRTRPGGRVIGKVASRTEYDSPAVLPVVRRRGDWLGVISSTLPNRNIGWVRANATTVPYRTRYAIDASLTRREIVVRRGGRAVLRFPIAVGSSSSPTPTGRYAVTDKLLTQNLASPYGCCILALSAHQPSTPQGWGGGDRIALHATNHPETIGTAASLGCMRAPTAAMRRVVRMVPLGTIVTITA